MGKLGSSAKLLLFTTSSYAVGATVGAIYGQTIAVLQAAVPVGIGIAIAALLLKRKLK